MKKLLKSLDYLTIIKYLCYFALFLLFNRLENEVYPYSIALLATFLFEGGSLIFTPLLFLTSFIVSGSVGLLGAGAISGCVLLIGACLYRKFHLKVRLELCVFVALSLLGYIFLGDTKIQTDIEKRIFVSIITVVISFFCLTAERTIIEKGLKFKPAFEEYLSIALIVSLIGMGVCNLISPLCWRAICVILILLSCYVYKMGIGTLIASTLGVSFALYYGDVSFVSIFVVWAILVQCLMPLSRYLSALSILASDYLVQIVFGFYQEYTLGLFLSLICGAFIFCIIPSTPLKRLKERLYSFREKHLERQTINRNRLMLAGKLYDLSGVFLEMANAFTLFNKSQPDQDKIKEAIAKEVISNSCKECEYYERCNEFMPNLSKGIDKMVDIGFAKGKLSLIDLSKEVSAVCLRPNNVLYSINRLLAEHRSRVIDRMNVKSGRDLLASEVRGVAEILKGLALESGVQLKFQSRYERAVSDLLFRHGILVSELMIFGDEERVNVSLIVTMKEFSIEQVTSVISSAVGREMMIDERAEISQNKCYLSFRQAPLYDAVFGVSRAVKDGSTESGDTHSVARISNDCFLVALSDGMGSGKDAHTISSTSLSLIESFYKAGLSSNLILGTVNKLLSINTEDSFTALDVAVIDLKDCTADFIKYGSPYGFIVGEKGVKIVEGNSLPLGILEQLQPSVCTTEINAGDMIVLLTDGISDAFGSSADMIDYLRSIPAKNPQTLADALLSRAIELNGGKKNDDMTALVVRVYKKQTKVTA